MNEASRRRREAAGFERSSRGGVPLVALGPGRRPARQYSSRPDRPRQPGSLRFRPDAVQGFRDALDPIVEATVHRSLARALARDDRGRGEHARRVAGPGATPFRDDGVLASRLHRRRCLARPDRDSRRLPSREWASCASQTTGSPNKAATCRTARPCLLPPLPSLSRSIATLFGASTWESKALI